MISPVPLQPDIRLTLDAEGVIQQAIVANRMADEHMEDWVGRPWLDTLDALQVAQVEHLVERAAHQGVSPFFQVSQHLPSGLVVPVEYMAVKLGDGMMAIGKDVRTVAQLESAMADVQESLTREHWRWRDVEMRQRAPARAGGAAVVVRSADFGVHEANRAALAALNPTGDRSVRVAGGSLLALVSTEDRKLLKSTLSRAMEQGKVPGVVVHFGAGRAPWLVKSSRVAANDPDYLLVRLLPFEDNLEAPGEAPMSSAELIEFLPDGFVVLDAEGIIVQANRAFVDMVEEAASRAVTGQHIGRWLFRPGGDQDMLLASLQAAGRVRMFPATILGSLGGRIDAEIAAVLKTDTKPAYIGACVHDVSRRFQAAGESEQLGSLLMSVNEQIGRTGLKSLVRVTVGLLERHYITEALKLSGGNRTAAAKLLGLSRQSLYGKLARYVIDAEDEEQQA